MWKEWKTQAAREKPQSRGKTKNGKRTEKKRANAQMCQERLWNLKSKKKKVNESLASFNDAPLSASTSLKKTLAQTFTCSSE